MATKQTELSEEQEETWLFLIRHVERYGFQPSVREMADALGVDKRAIQDWLARLEEKGLLSLPDGSRSRAIILNNVRFEAHFSKD